MMFLSNVLDISHYEAIHDLNIQEQRTIYEYNYAIKQSKSSIKIISDFRLISRSDLRLSVRMAARAGRLRGLGWLTR